ncbi:MAG: PAS domain S-box protein, partial [Nitrospinae bacterium]|nr:PAS domain S-box protein [Nitrospinota bacterium]
QLAREVLVRKEKETLLEVAKSQLEMRVRERTRSLGESNERLETELKLRAVAEEEVRRKEEEYRILFERIDAGVVVHDPTTRILSANAKALAILGLTPDQALGRTAMHPEWRFVDLDRRPLPVPDYPVNRVIATGEPFTGMIVGVNRPATGDVVWLVVNASPALDGRGAIRQVIVSFMDITEQMEARRELHRLNFAIEQSADCVVITEPDGTIIYVNHAFETTTGYAKEEALGKRPSILKSGKHDASFYRTIWASLSASLPWHGTIINKRKNGTLYEEELTISPIVDESGAIRYFVGNMRDITKEAAFARARDHFSAIVAHEIRTPLTKLELVKIFVANIRESLPDQELGRKLALILDEAMAGFDRLAHITNVFSHLVSHGEARLTATQDLSVVIPSSVSLSQQRSDGEGRKVPLVYAALAPEGELKVLGDYYLLNMAVEETLSNAIKYSRDGSPVTVTLSVRENQAVVEVRDQGKGIPPESVNMVFEPFFSLEEKLHHSSGKYKFCGGGLGLGLTVARLVVEVHGGLIEVESEGLDRGTTVRIVLPLMG